MSRGGYTRRRCARYLAPEPARSAGPVDRDAVDLPELIFEVMVWHPKFLATFTAAFGGETRLADMHVSVTVALCAHALNIGYRPIIADAPLQ